MGAEERAIIKFFVAGLPKSMKVGGVARFQRHGKVHMVPKRGNTEWVTLVGHEGRQVMPPIPFDGPVTFLARFFMPRPSTLPKKIVLPLKRPDLDNLLHKLTDQFNGVFWKDDSQIVRLEAVKQFAQDGRIGLEITVEEIEDPTTLALLPSFVPQPISWSTLKRLSADGP